jgi:hypothetical protein
MISPTWKGRDISEKKEIRKAITGKTRIWDNNPINNGFGYKNRFLKLAVVKDKPTPNIIKARITLNKMSRNV